MLVLSAVHSCYHVNNHDMEELVTSCELQTLLERTIRFLQDLLPTSSVCAAEGGLLEKLKDHLFGLHQPERI